MSDKEFDKRLTRLREDIDEEGVRIRRYTMDPRLKTPVAPDKPAAGHAAAVQPAAGLPLPDPFKQLRDQLEAAWKRWFALKGNARALSAASGEPAVLALETERDALERDIDLVQRDLISGSSYEAGVVTVAWLAAMLLFLILLYLYTHGVRTFDFSTFEPWSEWGPMKYGEVAFWSAFGALCALLFKASHYLARRDFDKWYRPWYFTTFLRAPFLTVILMILILEFVEWYGEGKWIQTYILEEGSKFYFIVLLSFCLGLAANITAGILGDLADGVTDFVSRAVGRVSDKLTNAVAKDA